MKKFSWLKNFTARPRHRSTSAGQKRRHQAEALESRVVLAAPTLAAISDVTFFSGSPVHIPLNGADADDDSLTFSVSSDNPSLITEIPEGNRSLRITVLQGDAMSPTISGDMTFQFFEDEASRATNRVITLADSGFYNGATFHRVVDNFVIQGGDPNGNPPGTGGSTLGTFNDQFDVDLQHNSTGLLSYAKSIDDSNDSQFFVTEFVGGTSSETSLRNLDFNHTVFGVQTTGEAIRAAISDTAVIDTTNDGINNPQTPAEDVVMTNVEVFVDDKNGVLRINAPEGTTGSAVVTVTVSDGVDTAQRVFNVNFSPDSFNGSPFLADIPSIRTLADTPTSFQLTALDAENFPNAAFLDEDELQSRSLFVPQVADPNEVTYDIGFLDGAVSVVPVNAFAGSTPITVSVGEFVNAIDYQVVPIEVVAAAAPWTVSTADHPGLTEANDGSADEIRVVRNGSKFEVFINGQATAQAEDVSVTTLTIDGSRDDDRLIVDFSGGNPFPLGGIVFNGYTVDPMEMNPPPDTGVDTLELTNGTLTTVDYSFTSPTDGTVSLNSDVLTFSGVEPVVDNLNVTDRVLSFTAGDDVIAVGDDGIASNGLSRITHGSTVFDFVTPSGSLTLNTLAGADTVTVSDLDSGPFGVTVNGGTGDDTITGGSGADLLNGDEDGDVIVGSAGNDTMNGGDGNDGMFGVSGSDVMNGGAGNDTLRGQATGGDVLTGGPGVDDLDGGSGVDQLVESLDDAVITLTDSALSGAETDTLFGFESATITLGDSANNFDGSTFSGSMTISGGAGSDTLFGGMQPDVIDGGDDGDFVIGSNGNDTILGGGGNDTLFGSGGSDRIDGGAGDDDIRGQGASNDTMTGGLGNDTINGGAGADAILEEADVDWTLTPGQLVGQGTDVLINVEQAHLTGGDSANTIDASTFTSPILSVTLRGAGGNDTLLGGDGGDILFGDAGDDELRGFLGGDDMYGGSGSDLVDGAEGNDWVRGQGTSGDTVIGGEGDDTIDGGTGTDFMFVNTDAPSLLITLKQMIGEGSDILRNIERLNVIAGPGDNDIDASAFGAIGVNLFQGGGGNDTITGTGLPDLIFGGEGNDVIETRFGDDTVHGEAGNDLILGEGDNDDLRGGDGDDTLSGGAGNDTLQGGADNDSLDGGEGNDGLSAAAGTDFLLGDAGEDTLYGGSGNDTLLGSGGSDTLVGGAGDDQVTGNGATDVLVGGSGTGTADSGDVFTDAEMGEIDENFMQNPLPDWVEEV